VLVLAEALTITSNQFLGADPFLKVVGALAIFFMTFALVGLAAGMGAIYPRFNAENLTQVAGSYGGIAFMVAAVLFILVEIGLLGWPSSMYLWYLHDGTPLPALLKVAMAGSFAAAIAVSVATFWHGMQRGIRALEKLA
jgi:ABC-2 type transport system permease protein